jgi:superfamily II DNA/RNA helicase
MELSDEAIQAVAWSATEDGAMGPEASSTIYDGSQARGDLPEAANAKSPIRDTPPLDEGCELRHDSPTAANPDSRESADSPDWKETGSDSGYWSSGSGSSKHSQDSGTNGWNGHFIGAFSGWGLSTWLAEALYKLNYEQPTPIQSKVMPCILQRHNVVVSELHPCTGKTSACVIAAMQLVNWNENVPQALLLASTREVAQYTYQLVLKLGESACNGRGAHERCCLLVGKTRVRDSVKGFEKGGRALVVATTGRLYDMVRRGVLQTDTVTLTILDGADAILQHLLIPELVALLPRKMHWAVMCARRTLHVDDFVTANMKDVQYIEAGSLITPNIEHLVVLVGDLNERVHLVDKICDAVLSGRVLIFCSVAGRKALDQHLKEKYVPLETKRENVTGYSAPTVSIYIASDALARGISMSNVAVVINLGLPPNSITYAQRAGRCCGSNQMAHVVVINMVDTDEKGAVAEVEKFCGVQMTEVKWERAVLQCSLACNVTE